MIYEAPGTEWLFFGKHRHRFESPDIYYSCIDGDVSGSDMLAQIHALKGISERQGHSIYWLADVRRMGSLTPEARQATAKVSKTTNIRAALRGSAIFGAAFTTRVIVSLMVRAVRALNPDKLRPLAFVETEAEARAFLALQRDAAGGQSRA